MNYQPGSLSNSSYNFGRFLYCLLKEQVDVYGNENEAKRCFNEIRKTYSSKEDRVILRAQLTEEQWIDLRRLCEIIKSGKIEKPMSWSTKADLMQTAKQKLPFRERKMAVLIKQKPQILYDVLGVKQIYMLKPEENYDEFGRADLKLMADRIGFPIELKDETSNERLSGQILKYIKGAIRFMKLGFYDQVQGVVIAPSYTQEALDQLRQIGVIVLQMQVKKEEYTLQRIDLPQR